MAMCVMAELASGMDRAASFAESRGRVGREERMGVGKSMKTGERQWLRRRQHRLLPMLGVAKGAGLSLAVSR